MTRRTNPSLLEGRNARKLRSLRLLLRRAKAPSPLRRRPSLCPRLNLRLRLLLRNLPLRPLLRNQRPRHPSPPPKPLSSLPLVQLQPSLPRERGPRSLHPRSRLRTNNPRLLPLLTQPSRRTQRLRPPLSRLECSRSTITTVACYLLYPSDTDNTPGDNTIVLSPSYITIVTNTARNETQRLSSLHVCRAIVVPFYYRPPLAFSLLAQELVCTTQNKECSVIHDHLDDNRVCCTSYLLSPIGYHSIFY